MRKSKILLIQIIGCVALGTIIGLGWWLSDGGKTCEKVSDCPGGVSNAQEMAFKNNWERESRIRYIKELLIGYDKGIVIVSKQGLYNLKNELYKLTDTEKPGKIYQGQWVEDTIQVGDWWSVGYIQRELVK